MPRLLRLLPVLLLAALCGYLLQSQRADRARLAALEHQVTAAADDYDLVGAMSAMQTWTDKLGRAADAANWELVHFYLHELEEGADELVERDIIYHEKPIGQLTGVMLVPAIEQLESAADAQDSPLFASRYLDLINTCNACHDATGYPSIKITPPSPAFNPWPQDFRP